jgi:hypothetical protein
MAEPIESRLCGALAPDGSQTAFMPTTEDLKRLWMARNWAGVAEKMEVEAGFDAWLQGERARASHDMPATLYNELTGELMSSGTREGLILAGKLQVRYGRSTRKRLGLD